MTSISDILDVTLVGGRKIGSLTISAAISEIHTDAVTITEHPVELGAPINDHVYASPRSIEIQCGWSNADASALLGAAAVSFDPGGANSMATGTYIDAVYSKLLRMQADHACLDVVTTRRKYANMLIESLSVTTNKTTGAALTVVATLKQINLVDTKSTTLPPRENQAFPAATAETRNAGTKSAVPVTPSPGGSFTPS